MTHQSGKITVVLMLVAVMCWVDAAAWGPRAHRAITGTAVQVIRRTYPNTFKTEEVSYEEDLLQGAVDGAEILNGGKSFKSETDAIAAVENEIRLLREVRKFGLGSHFSYHMGLLGALVADIILPFALENEGEFARLRRQIEDDIDAHLDKYVFVPQQRQREFIYGAREYFASRKVFAGENRKMIADDYQKGKGYNGYLKEAGQVYFCKATEAVADAWHSVLLIHSSYAEVPPSRVTVAWFLVDEIRYLLQKKKNMYEAGKAYENFVEVGKDLPEAFERVGDLFYAYGGDGRERGVREWRIAYDMAGADRRAIGKKLAEHYIKVGEQCLAKAAMPGSSDDDLSSALNAFTEALKFDQTNNVAAAKINETNAAIAERKERRQLNVNIIASAEKVKVQAEKKRLERDFAAAIDTYKQAIGLYEAVDDEFPDQANTAKNSIKEINKSITDVINEILDAGSDAIDQGDKALEENKFDEAIKQYELVPGIISVIPGDEKTTHGKNKKDMLELANKKIEDARMLKQRWEERVRQQEQAAKAAKGTAAPAETPPAAK